MVTIMLLFLLIYGTSMGGESQRVRQRLSSVVNRGGPTPTLISSALRQTHMSGIPLIGAFLSGRAWADKVARSLELADLRLRVGEYVAIRFVLAFMAFGAVIALVGRDSMSMLMGIGAALVGYHLPRFYVKRRIQRRLMKFNNQLVEALSLVANSLRSGFGLLQSMDLAAEQLDHPLATEFRRTINDVNVGASFEEALSAFNERINSKDLDIVITAISSSEPSATRRSPRYRRSYDARKGA
jgi:tight adherence protein B